MNLLKAIAILSIFISCKSEPVIDYKTAFKNCPMDTIRMYGPQGVSESYSPNLQGLIGAQLPEFTSTTIDQKEINKSYFEGKVSVINFWFEGCMPCEHEMPVFNKVVELYKDENVNFLAIGLNSPKDIEDFLLRKPFHFDHIAYGEPIIRDTFQSAWGYPITFVADKEMKIIFASRGLGDTSKVTSTQTEFIRVIEDALAKN
jgi:thiol-disulfide isomerase/thioredoxin